MARICGRPDRQHALVLGDRERDLIVADAVRAERVRAHDREHDVGLADATLDGHRPEVHPRRSSPNRARPGGCRGPSRSARRRTASADASAWP